ncbi:hypothetical protein [Neobacillus sp. LXY-1]|uniref:hypothetical protein n=1 Tax=Neobacillus sp. LXY-1 TaxID=3379133 RepID=UPI003EE03972
MFLIGVIIVIVLVHFLIIKPLQQRNRVDIYEPQRGGFGGTGQGYFGSGRGPGGFGGFGSFAGGMAAGALLTYLFEQGRIGFDQFHALQQLQDHEIMQELMDQNIIQEHEIDQLQEELGQYQDNNQMDDLDSDDDNDNQLDDNNFNGWDSGDDNWL